MIPIDKYDYKVFYDTQDYIWVARLECDSICLFECYNVDRDSLLLELYKEMEVLGFTYDE